MVMGYRIVKFKEGDRVAVIELAAPIDSQERFVRMSEEIAECCQKFRNNDKNSVLVIAEGVPGLFAVESRNGWMLMDLPGYVSISESIGECE
jgi:hypothetical protein